MRRTLGSGWGGGIEGHGVGVGGHWGPSGDPEEVAGAGASQGDTVASSPDLSDASVLGHTGEWHEGMEGATLTCLGDGNPPPTFNWTR